MSIMRDRLCPALRQEFAMPAPVDSPSSSRALVTLYPAQHETASRRPVERTANFLAQLIATARGLPQARERRRADPAEVIAAYRATVARIRALNDQ
jgi:hypothetical protein